jgi:hypothetical protein
VWFLLHKQSLGVPGKIEKRHALILVGFVGVLLALDLTLGAVLLLAPLVRHSIVEICTHQPVELIDVHRVDAVLEPLMLSLMALNRSLMLSTPSAWLACSASRTHSSTSSSK